MELLNISQLKLLLKPDKVVRMHTLANAVQKTFQDFLSDETGATAIEYGLIAAVIGISIIVGGKQMGDALNNKFECTADIMNSDTTTAECGS